MALAATSVWEVRTTGNDDNAGAFNPARSVAGIDRSQQDSPHVVIDGITITSDVHSTTTQVNLSGYTVTDADLGNHLRITGGAATGGLYEIIAVDTANNRWTLDRSAGTSDQSVEGRMGGCLATPGQVAGDAVFARSWIRSGTYVFTNDSVNVSGGRVITPYNNRFILEGYGTVRGDRGEKPTLKAPPAGELALTSPLIRTEGNTAGNGARLINIKVDGNGQSVVGIRSNSLHDKRIDCEVTRCSTGISGVCRMDRCYIHNNTDNGIFGAGVIHNCVVANNANSGIQNVTGGRIIECLFIGNNIGVNTSGQGVDVIRCTIADNFSFGSQGHNDWYYKDCIIAYNGSWGISWQLGGENRSIVENCAFIGNITGQQSHSPIINFNSITLTEDPFVDRLNGDYRLNDKEGGGKLLKEKGFGIPGQRDSKDIGAIQSASGSTGFTGIGRNRRLGT